jgi:hypothetical protein
VIGRVDYGDIRVCTDCYFAHHYGWHEVGGEWFAGESNTPADREPFGRWQGGRWEFADNVNGETGEGIDMFATHGCDGCGVGSVGARYRLHVWEVVPG